MHNWVTVRSLGRISLGSLVAIVCIMAGGSSGAEVPDPESESSRVFYALGLALAESVSRFELTESELQQVTLGLADGVIGDPRASLDDYRSTIDALAKERVNRTFEFQARIGEQFRAKLLAEYPDAATTESGGIAIELYSGSGAMPSLGDIVTVEMSGSLPDGTAFEQRADAEPLILTLGSELTPCVSEGLRRLRVGGVQRLVCPPIRGVYHPQIKAGSTLIYDIKMLKIEKGQPQ